MKPAFTFHVVPALPARLARLLDIAYNLRWSWDHDAVDLFHRLDSEVWESTKRNPVLLLGTVSQDVLASAAADDGFLAHMDRVAARLDAYINAESSWFRRRHASAGYGARQPLVAYFSAEFGLTECLSIFAGGLGVLAGDHLKSASDLGVPLVGVGLLYQQGYFRQYLNAAGWQQEAYEDNDFHNLPVTLERDAAGQAGYRASGFRRRRRVTAQVWRVQVGRVSLYLLDTNVRREHAPEDRDITDQLYGGDREMRLQQEIVLGIGGFRALEALGIEPTVCHMNEGHSAFLALERARRLMNAAFRQFAEARAAAAAGLIFTTHTPVPAGHDYFAPALVDHYFFGHTPHLGHFHRRVPGAGPPERRQRARAILHDHAGAAHSRRAPTASAGCTAQVSREMWKTLWPGVPVEEIPIGSRDQRRPLPLLDFRRNEPALRPLPGTADGAKNPPTRALDARVERIPAEELWRTHERRRERLVAFARRRLRQQLQRRGAPAGGDSTRRRGARSRRPDHRLRPAVRHLQARDPAAARSRAPGAAS